MLMTYINDVSLPMHINIFINFIFRKNLILLPITLIICTIFLLFVQLIFNVILIHFFHGLIINIVNLFLLLDLMVVVKGKKFSLIKYFSSFSYLSELSYVIVFVNYVQHKSQFYIVVLKHLQYMLYKN